MHEALYKHGYMGRLIRHIEDNLPSGLDTGSLSRVGFVSHTQLYRDFYNLTGHPVKEYIRKRRLSNALALIKASNTALADIAYECGYSSQQALCRAVKQTLGMTPLEYKDGEVYYFYPPYDGESIQSVIVKNETIPRTICLRFYHSSIRNIENKAIETFLNLIPEYNGRIFGRNAKQDGNRSCYELYLTDTQRDYTLLTKYGYQLSNITAAFTAAFASSTVKNDEDEINAAWNYLYHTWLQNSMFEYANEPYYEEYIVRNPRPAKLRLFLPIKKRADETKITLINDPGLYFLIAGAKGYNAEKAASKTVIEYLSEHYPYVVKTSKEFYLHKEMNSCVCGVRIHSELRIKDSNSVESMAIEKGRYLMLTSCVMGDYDRYAQLLLSFASDNGMAADKRKIFAVYDAKESFDNPKIRMYCPIKFEIK